MRKRNFNLGLLILFLIAAMALFKCTLPSIMPSQKLNKNSKRSDGSSAGNDYNSGNNLPMFSNESDNNSIQYLAEEMQLNTASSNYTINRTDFGVGIFETNHHESSTEEDFNNDISLANTINSSGGAPSGSSDMGIAVSIPSINISLSEHSDKEKNTEEKDKSTAVKGNMANRNSFFNDSEQIMATPPPPPPIPQVPLDDYYLLLMAVATLIGTLKLIKQQNIMIG